MCIERRSLYDGIYRYRDVTAKEGYVVLLCFGLVVYLHRAYVVYYRSHALD